MKESNNKWWGFIKEWGIPIFGLAMVIYIIIGMFNWSSFSNLKQSKREKNNNEEDKKFISELKSDSILFSLFNYNSMAPLIMLSKLTLTSPLYKEDDEDKTDDYLGILPFIRVGDYYILKYGGFDNFVVCETTDREISVILDSIKINTNKSIEEIDVNGAIYFLVQVSEKDVKKNIPLLFTATNIEGKLTFDEKLRFTPQEILNNKDSIISKINDIIIK